MNRRNVLLTILVAGLVLVGFTSCFAETVSKGIRVVPVKKTVYANEEGQWFWTLKLSSDTESTVTVNRFVSKRLTMKGNYTTHYNSGEDKLKELGYHKLQPDSPKTLRGGFPSRNDIHFEDFIFIGTDEEGNEVMGAARIHFVKEERKKGVGPFA